MSGNWSEEELKASVEAYVDMLSKYENETPFVKNKYYSDLSERFGRTPKAFAYRMSNISHVYDLMGRKYLSGLKPAVNVGPTNIPIIQRLIYEVEETKLSDFEKKVTHYRLQKNLEEPSGVTEPAKKYSTTIQFSRDPKVKAWVLKEANGECENCGSKTTFMITSGEQFFEVHHLKRLADGGSDTTTNAVCLCPNCHRELHYGINQVALVEKLYIKINRLLRE